MIQTRARQRLRPWGGRSVTLTVALLLLVACGGGKPDGPGPGRGGQGQRPGGNGPGGGPPQLPTMAVAVEPAVQGDIATYYRATASLDPDKRADVLARVSGVIERLVAEEGDRVTEGQVLLHIVDDEYRHRATMARVDLEKQEARLARAQKIFEQGLSSAEDFDAIRTDRASAKANLDLAELELSYTNVRAPFTGHVVRRFVDQGQTVSNGTALYSLADMDRLLARVFIPAKEFRSIRPDQPVQLVVTSTGDRLTGRIDLVNPLVDPESGTIKVTVEVTRYPPTTRPGDFVEVSIVTDAHADSLLVPRIAVVTERGQRSVYVVDGDTAQQRAVEVGFEDDDHAEILSGLEAGELVVIQGQRALRDGQPVSVLDALELDAPSAAGADQVG
ncbi:MAG: efflux RND transporter periplasmic adaptor subunit [Candidatus Sulfomarinibacteraceae bacterium]